MRKKEWFRKEIWLSFMIVDTQSYISHSLLHKLIGLFQSEQYHILSAHSFSQLPWLLQSRSVRANSIFQTRGITQKVHQRILKLVPQGTSSARAFQRRTLIGVKRCLKIERDRNLVFHSNINLDRFTWFGNIITEVG